MAFRSQPPQEANFSMQSSASIEPGSAIEYSADALVVRAFVQEVHTAAMLAVGATSAINLTQTIGSAVPLIATRNLVHGFKGSIDHWPQRILEEQLTKDTVSVAPGERYDIEFVATETGQWMLHCHILHHTTNDNVEPGGLMLMINVTE